jgi:hypothetical protein
LQATRQTVRGICLFTMGNDMTAQRKAFDRTYWRGVPDARLIEAGRDSGDEMAIAMAERLADLRRRYDDLAGEYASRDEWRDDA